jgi:hypothetical protein
MVMLPEDYDYEGHNMRVPQDVLAMQRAKRMPQPEHIESEEPHFEYEEVIQVPDIVFP